MIDRVQQAMERLAPELDSYLSRRLFTEKETRKIAEIRRHFENKLQRSDKQLQDFLQYISSEQLLERIRSRRMRNMGLAKSESDVLLTKNILSLYRRALYYFSEPILIKEFADYAIKRKEYSELKDVLGGVCAKRLRDVDLWIFSAQQLWMINEVEDARNVFLKCISINRDIRVYTEFFRMECTYAARAISLNREMGLSSEDDGDIERGELALIIFKLIPPQEASSSLANFMEIAKIVPGLPEKIHAHLNATS